MPYPRTIRNFTAFVDGFGYAGIVESATLPEPELNTAEYRGGGMDAPIQIDMGIQALNATLVFKEHRPELISLLGSRVTFVLRGGAQGEDDFETDTLVYTMRGRVTKKSAAEFKAGDENMLTLEFAVDKYREEHNGAELIHIDVEAGIRTIGGTDQMAGMRTALALGGGA